MDSNFWLQKWKQNQIAFHRSEAHPLLAKHLPALELEQDSRVFLPLCGKTLDIAWLLGQGYRVAGAELSELAIQQLFAELGVEPAVSELGKLKQYSADGIDIFVGDIFELSPDRLGAVDAIYDRAALVALPEGTRDRYTTHLIDLTQAAPQLLICFEYDQSVMNGPPFSINREMVEGYYGDRYQLNLAESSELAGGLKGRIPTKENVWLMRDGLMRNEVPL